MAEHGHEFIIVKRHEEEEHEAHSSAWKVAHADFMTAMMAFFLIMWLINATDDKVRRGISNYFNPIHMSDGQSGMKGLAKPGEDAQKEKEGGVKQSGKGNNKKDEFNPMKLSPGASAEKAAESGSGAAALTAEGGGASIAGDASGGRPQGEGTGGGGILATEDHVGNGAASASIGEPGGASPASHGDKPGLAAKGQIGGGEGAYGGASSGLLANFGNAQETAAFQDPYAVLAKLAAQYASDHPTSKDLVVGDDRKPGIVGGEVDRDPFDPVYWQLAGSPEAKSDQPGKPGTAAAVPDGATPDAGAATVSPLAKAELPDVALRPTQEAPVDAAPVKVEAAAPVAPEPAKIEAAPAASAPDQAGAGEAPPPEPAKMEAAKAEVAPTQAPPAPAKPTVDTATLDAADAVRQAVAKALGPTLAADASPKVSVVATSEGVAIDLTDATNFSMFDVGSAVPKGKVVVLMEEVAKALAGKPGDIIIRGHTDGRAFHSELYDNWRLSAARAHMAYYMLTRGGLPESRFVRIEGAADRDLKNKGDPMAAENRRIEILLVPAKP